MLLVPMNRAHTQRHGTHRHRVVLTTSNCLRVSVPKKVEVQFTPLQACTRPLAESTSSARELWATQCLWLKLNDRAYRHLHGIGNPVPQ